MRNAAGDEHCDDYLREELITAGIPYEEMEFFRTTSGEVPSALIGLLDGWRFRRAWYYWVAEAHDTLLLFEFADPLHQKFGQEVRVAGHCGCPSPREWYKEDWQLGVSLYHVDTQEGLNALANAIILQSASLNGV